MDRIDYGILQALQNDARTTNRQLANSVGLAASSCLERVRKLESTGVLRGYHADVDPDALGVGMLALIAIRVDQHGRSGVERISDLAASREEVVAKAIDSQGGFAMVLSNAKALLEHSIDLNLIYDSHPELHTPPGSEDMR